MSDKPAPRPQRPAQNETPSEPKDSTKAAGDSSNRRKKPAGRRPVGRLEGLFTGIDALPSAPVGEPSPQANEQAVPAPPEAPKAPTALPHAPIFMPPATQVEKQQSPPAASGKPSQPLSAATKPQSPLPEAPKPPPATALTLSAPLAGAAAQRQTPAQSIQPGDQVISAMAVESLQTGKAVVQPASNGQPAALAFGRRLSGSLAVQDDESGLFAGVGDHQEAITPALLLEVIDDTPGRVWSEDELLLVEQVTDQLTLALENARLFEEARQRNEELATLNQVTSAVSTMSELDQALPMVLAKTISAVGFESGLISIARQPEGVPEGTGPAPDLELAVQTGLPDHLVERLKLHGLAETACDIVYQTTQMVYLPDLCNLSPETLRKYEHIDWAANAIHKLRESGFQAYLGVPLMSKGAQLGTICVFCPEPREVSASRLRLIDAIGKQVGVVIENVRLFEETQRSAEALQISERYQKGVAQAVSALTERGMAALSEAMSILGEAARVDRVHYFETQVDQNGPYWRLINEWRVPGRSSQLSNPALRRVGLRGIATWVNEFRTRGVAILPEKFAPVELQIGEAENDVLKSFGSESALLFAVQGRHEVPGCVVFEQANQARVWMLDEVAALQTAASALANTLAREDLFTQVQSNLAETEAQYQASSRLNNATTYNDILTVLRQHTILGHLNAGVIALNLFDHAWTRTNRPEWIIPIARWSAAAPNEPPPERYPLTQWKNAELLLDPERPTMVLDAIADPRLDENARRVYTDELGARSLLFIPLNVSGRWIGQIIGAYRQTTGFPDQEVRRLTSLAGQAAVAVENIRLLEETRRRNEELNAALGETETLYQAGAELNAAHGYDDILKTLRKHTVLGQAKSTRIELYDQAWNERQIPERSQIISRWDDERGDASQLAENTLNTWKMVDAATLEMFRGASARVLHLADKNSSLSAAALTGLYPELTGTETVVIAPLITGGQEIGYTLAFYSHAVQVDDDDLRRLTALSGQAAVALQTLRLLEESQRRARQLQTAAEIARDTTAATLALDALLGRSVNLVCDRFGYCDAAIYLLDENGLEATAAGVAEGSTALMEGRQSVRVGDPSTAGQVMETGQPLVISSLGIDEQSIDALELPSGTMAELGIPLKLGERVIGVLDVHADRPDAFSEDDVAVLQTLADQIAVAVDNARAYALTQKAVEEIREADRLKTQFLANMSHELRTPLNSIIGFSRVILKGIDGPINDQQAQDLSAIYSSGQHLLGLINDVLDLSRIEAGKMDLAFENDVNLGEIIHAVMSTTLGLVKDKPIELRHHIAQDLPLVTIDPMKIRQVLINLLSNASKFTEAGAIIINAEPCTYHDKPGVIVRVIDSGPGIAAEDQVKLFQPFSQVDGSLTRKTGGSGLGLSICHHLVRMHGGQIGLESEVGRGTTFYFILPVQRDESELEDNEDEPKIAPAAAPSAVKKKATGPLIMPVPVPRPDGNEHEKTHQPLKAEPKTENAPADQPNAAVIQAVQSGVKITPPAPAPESAPPAASESIRLALAVDRDPKVTDMYRRYLTGRNLSVISLSDLGQVVAAARSLQPAVITLDGSMQSNGSPDDGPLDGWQVLKTLTEDPITRPIPVIICTLADESKRAYSLGATGYLMKPILEDDLVREVARVLKSDDSKEQ